MAVVVTTAGANYYAQVALGIAAPQPTSVFLYVNFRMPQVNDTISLYKECSWPGYSRFLLTPSEWTGSAVNGVATYNYPLITFNFDASGQAQQTVFGYLIIDSAGDVLYAEQFAAPFPISSQGGSIPLLLQWVDEQCPM